MKTSKNSILTLTGAILFTAIMILGSFSHSKASEVDIRCEGKGEICLRVRQGLKLRTFYKHYGSGTVVVIENGKEND